MANDQQSATVMPNGTVPNANLAHDHKSIELSFLRKRLHDFQSTIIRDFERRIDEELEALMQEIRKHELQLHEFKHFAKSAHNPSSTWNNRVSSTINNQSAEQTDIPTSSGSPNETVKRETLPKMNKSQRQRALPDKIFLVRESYLTALLEVDHMRTIYHIFTIILFVLLMNSICYDYFVEGRVNFGLGTFKSGFAGIHYVAGIWLLEHVFVFLLYYAFKGWALVRAKLVRQAPLQHFWTHSCLITYIASQLLFLYVASALCLKLDLPFPSASALLLETIRLLMKMHAFIRTNAARVLEGKQKSDSDIDAVGNENDKLTIEVTSSQAITLPPFSCYLYFLFAPTLIYRDHYPRTAQIRWKFALTRLLEVVATAFVYSYIHERHIKMHFGQYGRDELNASALIVKLFGMLMPSAIIFLSGFYMILHSWLNFTSELLRFGDRMFYKDWWTSSSYDAYYRNWNVVVHDWLYEYIYKDFYNHIFKGSKVAASLMVFFTSALVHEHVLGFALQLFFPIMFVFFAGIGVVMVFLTRKAPKCLGNIVIWWSLIVGNGLMISLYSMEYYARLNCPRTYETWRDYVTPAVWSCYNK